MTRLVDAAELAEALGTSRTWVYAHRAELPHVRLGTGPRARLRFDLERVLAAVTADVPATRPDTTCTPVHVDKRRPRQSTTTAGAPLLPVKGGGRR